MIKKTVSKLLALIVLTALFAACSKQVNYTSVIPSDASMVTAIDLKSLIDKAGLNDKENEATKQQVMDALKKEMSASAFQQMEKIMKNPAESGIDISVPVYLFMSPAFSTPAIVAQVCDESALNASLETLVQEQVAQPVTEADGYSFTVIGNGVLAFNDSAMLIASGENESQMEQLQASVSNLMKQEEENSIAKAAVFQKMQATKGDIKFFASMGAVPELYKKQLNITLPQSIPWEDITLIAGVSFNNGEIVFTSEPYLENEEVKAMVQEQLAALKTPSHKFDKYFPASTLMLFNYSVDGAKMYDLMLHQYEEMSKSMTEYKQMVDMFKDENVKELICSLNGDITMGFTGVTMNIPTFVAYAEVKDAAALEKLYQNRQSLNLPKGGFTELNKNEYAYKLMGLLNIYFGVKDNILYLTNDENVYRNFGTVEKESIDKAPYAAEMKGSSAFVAINVEAILDLPAVKMAANMGGGKVQPYINLASKLSYFSAYSKDTTGQVTLCLKDKDTNALKQIVDIVKQLADI